MPITQASNVRNSLGSAGISGVSRQTQSLPESSQLMDGQFASQASRFTLPRRSSSTELQHSSDLQQRAMSENLRSSQNFEVQSEEVSERATVVVQKETGAIAQQSQIEVKDPRKELARMGLDLNNLRENTEKAKTAGVDVAKKTFWSKLAGVAVSTLAAGVVVGLAVATGGTSLIVAAGIAGLVLAKQAADTRCAYKVLQNERALVQGNDKPHKDVPMGADWVANKMYAVISKLKPSMSEESKMSMASKISTGVNVTLAMASVANGGITGALSGEPLLLTVLPASISVANVGIMHFLGKATANTKEQIKNFSDENMLERFIEVNEKYNEQINDSMDARYLDAETLNSKKEALLKGIDNLAENFDPIALRMEEQDLAVKSKALQGNDEEDLAYVKSIFIDSPVEYGEKVSFQKYEQAIAQIEADEKAENLSDREAKKAAAKQAGLHVAEMTVEIGVEKGVEKAVHALTHAEVDVDVPVMAAFTTLAMLKSAYDLHSAVKELNQVKAPVAKHMQNIDQINRQFDYII